MVPIITFDPCCVAVRFVKLALIAGLVICLSSCSLLKRTDPRVCPSVSILDHAGVVTLYQTGNGRDLTDVTLKARLEDLTTSCAFQGPRVSVLLKVSIIGVLGPSGKPKVFAVPFFVAISDPEQKILAKEVFESALEIPVGHNSIRIYEETEQIITLENENQSGLYEVIIGLQLTDEQLGENRLDGS